MTSTKQLINRINACQTRDELEIIQDVMYNWIETMQVRADAVMDCLADSFASNYPKEMTDAEIDTMDERGDRITDRYEAQTDRLTVLVEDAYESQWNLVDWAPGADEEE
jgi:hypothetical protein